MDRLARVGADRIRHDREHGVGLAMCRGRADGSGGGSGTGAARVVAGIFAHGAGEFDAAAAENQDGDPVVGHHIVAEHAGGAASRDGGVAGDVLHAGEHGPRVVTFGGEDDDASARRPWTPLAPLTLRVSSS